MCIKIDSHSQIVDQYQCFLKSYEMYVVLIISIFCRPPAVAKFTLAASVTMKMKAIQ
jgi:hypothetical protein